MYARRFNQQVIVQKVSQKLAQFGHVAAFLGDVECEGEEDGGDEVLPEQARLANPSDPRQAGKLQDVCMYHCINVRI